MQVFSERGCKYGTLETVCPGVDRKGVKIEEAKWMDIRSDRQKGLSYTEIGRKYNIDPRTAKRYAQAETRPVYSLRPSKLDPYKEQIAVWLEEAPYSAERILEKIREQGLDGGHCALPGFVDSKNEEKTERNAGYLVVSQSGGGMLRQGTREGIRRTPVNRGMRAHRVVKGLDISEDVCHGLCP